MGMFDDVKYKGKYFQTKDLECLMDYYFIDHEGYIVRKVCEYDWVEDPERLLGGYLSEKFMYWKPMPNFTGYINVYDDEEDLYLFLYGGKVFYEIEADSVKHNINGYLTEMLYVILESKGKM